jgi:hypothetical protein
MLFVYRSPKYVPRLVSSATFQSRGDGDGVKAETISVLLQHNLAEQDKPPISLASLPHHEHMVSLPRKYQASYLTLHLAADEPRPSERCACVSRQNVIFASLVAKRYRYNLRINRASCRALRSSQRIVQRMFTLNHARI